MPVINMLWEDAQEYVKWLSKKTSKRYRLLSEAEWEYAARGGTSTPFHTGETLNSDQANFDGNYSYNGSRKGLYRRRTSEVGTFPSNSYGLHDMHGNVTEWVQDCYVAKAYQGMAPSDGSAYEVAGCSARGLRGGSWFVEPAFTRSAYRDSFIPGFRYYFVGFRLARTLP